MDGRLDDVPFRTGLSAAVRSRWTGQLRALSGLEPVGGATLCRGRVAWLAARAQGADVGTFLARLGGVGRRELDAFQERFRESDAGVDFVAALRQANLAPEAVLRRCLLLHHRAALRSLLRSPGARLERREGSPPADEDLLFTLGEIMPELNPMVADPTSAPPAPAGGDLDGRHLLAPLAEIPGHRASAVMEAEGRIRIALARSPEVEAPVLGAVLSSAVEAAGRLARFAAMGSVSFLVISGETGTLVGRWVDPARRHFVATLVAEEAQIGIAKHRIRAVLPAVAEWIARQVA
jgi:predicted regulator of Ras-like GTPase activity (Roadblock/LC7/MglB family)